MRTPVSSIDDIESRRAARKADLETARLVQLAIDLEALDAAEIQYGDSNIGRLDIPFTPDLPTICLVRTPNPAEMKRYRFMTTPQHDKDRPDLQKAAEALDVLDKAGFRPEDKQSVHPQTLGATLREMIAEGVNVASKPLRRRG